ncbi:hypothetical protein CXG81DRAFT_17160 [Caulochytrium protostelioides]|uniref:Uncharacterized protein n=1 Tax=Caulochytrium protostelioides TaxID=1555241 RepID=A0A4P9XDR8_9FUNG|nr:hypothetical protein CXG81DRAFT_17160 [Caulochytrium protostelioides]|eukprot:RKP03310.1 hypothetical protein CXG81DRAFT_17160 [Caulochytrium protostelioides]
MYRRASHTSMPCYSQPYEWAMAADEHLWEFGDPRLSLADDLASLHSSTGSSLMAPTPPPEGMAFAPRRLTASASSASLTAAMSASATMSPSAAMSASATSATSTATAPSAGARPPLPAMRAKSTSALSVRSHLDRLKRLFRDVVDAPSRAASGGAGSVSGASHTSASAIASTTAAFTAPWGSLSASPSLTSLSTAPASTASSPVSTPVLTHMSTGSRRKRHPSIALPRALPAFEAVDPSAAVLDADDGDPDAGSAFDRGLAYDLNPSHVFTAGLGFSVMGAAGGDPALADGLEALADHDAPWDYDLHPTRRASCPAIALPPSRPNAHPSPLPPMRSGSGTLALGDAAPSVSASTAASAYAPAAASGYRAPALSPGLSGGHGYVPSVGAIPEVGAAAAGPRSFAPPSPSLQASHQAAAAAFMIADPGAGRGRRGSATSLSGAGGAGAYSRASSVASSSSSLWEHVAAAQAAAPRRGSAQPMSRHES